MSLVGFEVWVWLVMVFPDQQGMHLTEQLETDQLAHGDELDSVCALSLEKDEMW